MSSTGCHEAVFRLSRAPWEDRRPSPRRGQTLSPTSCDLFAILASIAGANSYRSVHTFVHEHLPRLRKLSRLKWRRAPAYTTIRGILLQLDPAGVERVFREHARTLCAHEKTPRGEHRHVAFDGKALCNSFGQFEDRKAAHVLSAFAVWRSSSLTSSVTKNPTKSPGPRSSSPN
jgi:DDE_Tnp_1-associated